MVVASTIAYPRSGSSDSALNIHLKTSALRQSRKCLNAALQFSKRLGRSHHGQPVRAMLTVVSTNSRLPLPLRTGSLRLPRNCGSIFPLFVRQHAAIHSKRGSHLERFVNAQRP